MFRSLLFTFLVLATACKPDPVADRAESLSLAIAAQDRSTIEASHVLATPHSDYCGSEQFARVLEEVRRGSTEEKCDRFRAARPEEVNALQDEALLLFQIARSVCEDAQLTCEAYGKRVLSSQIDQDPLWGEVQGPPTVKKVIRDGAQPQAVVYVEFLTADGPVVRALKLRELDGRWLLAEGFPTGEP